MNRLSKKVFRRLGRELFRLRQALIRLRLGRQREVKIGAGVKFLGLARFQAAPGSKITIGARSTLVSDFRVNLAGINHPCLFTTMTPQSEILIGEDCGFSGVTIAAQTRVVIGDHTAMGANSCIYDTDFHPLDPLLRRKNNPADSLSAPVSIGCDVWIGANVIILKGVTIGDRAVIGAGSVVTRDVAPDSIYAGNPARFIRKI